MSNQFIDKQSIKEIGLLLFQLRCQQHLFLYQVAKQTGIPSKIIEGLEIGRYIKLGKLRQLTKFYGKKITLKLE